LILVLQIKLKYMMSLKEYLIQECQEFVLVPTKPIKTRRSNIRRSNSSAFRSFKIAHRLDSRFSCANGHEKIPEIAKEMGFKTIIGAWIGRDNDKMKWK
jgi:hypothetical protein